MFKSHEQRVNVPKPAKVPIQRAHTHMTRTMHSKSQTPLSKSTPYALSRDPRTHTTSAHARRALSTSTACGTPAMCWCLSTSSCPTSAPCMVRDARQHSKSQQSTPHTHTGISLERFAYLIYLKVGHARAWGEVSARAHLDPKHNTTSPKQHAPSFIFACTSTHCSEAR